MKKILILLLIFASCNTAEYYFPSKDFFEKNKPTEIRIKNLNFQELTDSIRNGLYKNEFYYIKINNKNIEYKITPFAYTGGLIKEKNVLEISKDSVKFSFINYPIDKLSYYLKSHYENNGKNVNSPDSYKKAILKLVLKKEDDSQTLNKLLLKVVKTYQKTNIKLKDSIELNISFNYHLDYIYNIPPQPIF